ncbi:MAG: polysaccharide biosynthesis C-terminal domain-containing protein [Holosporales bacterium]|jgi:MATE family multidrug resistance protein|nr:polysaccharide biosynthesis C-terminal domain-containing protein [Holosporales bacterium]
MELANSNRAEIDCSIKCIIRVALPLILSALSSNLLLITDRAILAYYAIDAMNAATLSGNLVVALTCMLMSVAGVAQIYVGQNNGAGNYEMLAVPTWQMIRFSALISIALIPIAYYSEYINFLPSYYSEEGIKYQKVLLYFGGLPSLQIALASFFIGQGKGKIVTIAVVCGGIFNTFFDYLFVFGVKDLIPEMGCKGAAIATVLAQIFQISILSAVFFNKSNRLRYKTLANRKFDKKVFLGCLKIGFPLASGRFLEILAWLVIATLFSYVSKDLATINGVAGSLHALFAFIADGLNKSSSTISANFIGRKDIESIKKVFKMFIKIITIFCGIMIIPFVIRQDIIFSILSLLRDDVSMLYEEMSLVFRLTSFNIAICSISSIIWGILISGGDTKIPVIISFVGLFGFIFIPTCILFYCGKLTSAAALSFFCNCSNTWSFIMLYRRYKSLKWYKQML